jgi:hypothetical protein
MMAAGLSLLPKDYSAVMPAVAVKPKD